MIIVDTNVWSETTRPMPEPGVIDWLRRHASDVVITSITIAELLAGVAMLRQGRRRDGLSTLVEGLIARSQGRILDFDERAARAFATIRASLRRQGREPGSAEDVMIAAIAVSRGFPVATRNTADFDGTGVRVINPWHAP